MSIPTNIIENTKAMGKHWDTLMGERPAGSQWGRDFTEVDFTHRPWEEVDHADVPNNAGQPHCRYFVLRDLHRYFTAATVSALPLDALSETAQRLVRIRQGAHGPELYVDALEAIDEGYRGDNKARVAWCIVGEHQGKEVIFTAHPGAPLQPLSKGVAVKI